MKSELFIECAKNVVDFYNLTQESIGSKNRMEYPKVIEEVKPREWYVPKETLRIYASGSPEVFWDQSELIKVREVIE